MPVNLYYTQKVRVFQQEQVKYSSKSAEIHLKRTKHQCPCCGSTDVKPESPGRTFGQLPEISSGKSL